MDRHFHNCHSGAQGQCTPFLTKYGGYNRLRKCGHLRKRL